MLSVVCLGLFKKLRL